MYLAAEGKTMIAVAVIGWANDGRIHAQAVSGRSRYSHARPAISVSTNAVDSAIRRIDIPTTDKS